MDQNQVSSIIAKNKVKGISLIILGGYLVFIFGCTALTLVFYNFPYYLGLSIVMFIFGAFGGWIFVKGRRKLKLNSCYNKYKTILDADPMGSLDRIARLSGDTVDTVEKNLQKLIQLGYFPECYIDLERRRLVLPGAPDGMDAAINREPSHDMEHPSQTAQETVAVSCPSCGALNHLPKNSKAECEYCGNMLYAK